MMYAELKKILREFNDQNWPHKHLTVHIVFTEDSFDKQFPRLSRTYRLSSDNKAFWPHAAGYSIFSDCLDGTDQGVRLDWYMAEEGHPGGWKVEDCYILEQMRDAVAIPNFRKTDQDDGTVAYFFGDTTIRATEKQYPDTGRFTVKPIGGDQTVCGEWVELEPDVVAGYCTLLARQLNGKEAKR